jgi:hypothetical protein
MCFIRGTLMKTKYVRRDYASELVPALLSAVSGPYSSHIRSRYENGDHRAITSLEQPDASQHVGPGGWRDFFCDYQSYNLLRKSKSLVTGIDTRRVALGRFLADEKVCSDTNEFLCRPGQRFNTLLDSVRKEVKSILGSFSWDRAERYLSHGPGACIGIRRSEAHAWYKNGCINPSATQGALALAEAYIASDILRSRLWQENGVSPKGVAGSKVTTVPKDAKTDRVIAVEPLLNMFFQRGIGGLMRSRLKKSGCDLNDQTINQRRAFEGSVTDELATIDLSSASDTISRELVERIIPSTWLEAMRLVRCSHSVVPNSGLVFLQKWSSMGNGYTFELESLIFLAIARVISRQYSARHAPSVYGDDIVVDNRVAGALCETLTAVGFKINSEKSFVWGPFRESCGKHYFRGIDVTPFYLREKIESDEQILRFCNGVRRLASRFNCGYGLSAQFESVWKQGVKLLSRQSRSTHVPDGYGDAGLLVDFDEVSPKPKASRGQVEGYRAKVLTRVYDRREFAEWPALITSLGSLEKGGPMPVQITGTGSKTRKRLVSAIVGETQRYRYRYVSIDVTQWTNTGPWLSLP